MRVHELAKELNLPSKEALDKLIELGADVKSHMSAVDDTAADLLRLSLKEALEKKTPRKAAPATRKAQDPAAAAPAAARPAPPAEHPKAEPIPAKPDAKPAGERVLVIHGAIVVKDLAEELKLKPNHLIAELMAMNVFASISDRIDVKVAQKIGAKHGVTIEHEKKVVEHKPVQKAGEEEAETDRPEDLRPRSPVVTFLGHVDHGKTSLLDRIRNAMVAKGEAGGITQHIGAYSVDVNDRKITFLDTPGHEAFTAMRARGAHLTDIAVIIIAADDGVMPQTKEAIQHAKASNASIMVAINKMDLPAAVPDRVRQQLQGLELTPEEWGGSTICCEVSAQTGKGIDRLLEMILLQADMLDLKANPKRRAQGYVIEARLEAGMGPTANILVKQGTVKVGDIILAGPYWGRVKALINDHGIRVRTAEPSTPVRCLGLSGVPDAGAEFRVCSNEKAARIIADERTAEIRTRMVVAPKKASLKNLFDHLEAGNKLALNLVLKSDVQGSLEAIRNALDSIKSEKVSLNIVLSGVGNITMNDILLASASNAVIVGFNVAKESGVNAVAKKEGVEIRLHSIIYNLVDEIRESMTGLLAPQLKDTVIGHAEVAEVFVISKIGSIAGCMVTDGRIAVKARARVKRKDDIIYEGVIVTLRRFQNDASEVREGQECGLRLDNFGSFEKGDVLEVYEVTKMTQSL